MNKSFKRITVVIIGLALLITGCKKEDKNQDLDPLEEIKEEVLEVSEDNREEIEIKDTLGLSLEALMDIKADGLEEKDEDGKIVALHYVEDFFGVDNVETTYYFDDNKDEVIAISLYFPKGEDIREIMDNISLELGEPDLIEEDSETSEYRAEWLKEDNIYHSLMDYGEFIEFNVVELIGD